MVKTKFKPDDIVILTISYSICMYKVIGIFKSLRNHQYYKLEGLGELKMLDNGSNPFRAETKHYSPLTTYMDYDRDLNARLATEAEKVLFGS